MSDLSERLAGRATNADDKGSPVSEFDGETGFVQSRATPADEAPDFDNILREFGYDPEKVQIVGSVRTSRWQAFDGRWLCSYRFNIESRTVFELDLPALYAEVARTPRTAPRHVGSGATAVVCWADVQTGKVDHLGGLKELLERLDEKRAALDEYLVRGGFDHVVIADCGDIIEGFQNFDAQTRTNALSIMDQVDVAATELWKAIRTCANRAPVDVLSIPSNHCRWAKGKSLVGKVTDDWGLHVSKRLERMNDEVGLPVAFHRAEEWMETLEFDVRGTRLGLAHGHQANNPDQIKNWWAKMAHGGVLSCDVLVTGHFHFPSLRPSGKNFSGRSKWHIQASTLDNGSAWVRNKMGEDGDPALTVFSITDDGFNPAGYALL